MQKCHLTLEFHLEYQRILLFLFGRETKLEKVKLEGTPATAKRPKRTNKALTKEGTKKSPEASQMDPNEQVLKPPSLVGIFRKYGGSFQIKGFFASLLLFPLLVW